MGGNCTRNEFPSLAPWSGSTSQQSSEFSKVLGDEKEHSLPSRKKKGGGGRNSNNPRVGISPKRRSTSHISDDVLSRSLAAATKQQKSAEFMGWRRKTTVSLKIEICIYIIRRGKKRKSDFWLDARRDERMLIGVAEHPYHLMS